MKAAEQLFAVVADLAMAIQAAAIYPETHSRVQELLARLHGRLTAETSRLGTLNLGFFADHVVADAFPLLGNSPTIARLIREMRQRDMEKVSFRDGITPGELKRFVFLVATGEKDAAGRKWEFISYGRIRDVAGDPGASSDLVASLSPGHVLYGAADVLKDLLSALAGTGGAGAPSISEGRDIVSSVVSGLHKEEYLIERLIRMRAHDDYTVTHSLNVCVIVVAQAARLGLSEPKLQEIGLAALLHDIGKEMVPAEILRKPDKLSAAEFARMAGHPVLGANRLRKIDCGSELPMIVCFEHHIKHDRSGYPKPSYAAPLNPVSHMTQIADVYDALRTYRPYRESLDRDTSLAIMAEGRGTEFEPKFFDAFRALARADQDGAGA